MEQNRVALGGGHHDRFGFGLPFRFGTGLPFRLLPVSYTHLRIVTTTSGASCFATWAIPFESFAFLMYSHTRTSSSLLPRASVPSLLRRRAPS